MSGGWGWLRSGGEISRREAIGRKKLCIFAGIGKIIQTMQIDIRWMEEWFDKFNRQYFDGKLPRPLLKTGRSRTRLGSYSCRRVWRLGRPVKQGQTITLSCFYDLQESEYKSVLLHEMIHYVIDYTGLKDTSPHGVVFRGMMARLNRDGWDIRVSHRARSLSASSSPLPSPRLVVAVVLRDGQKLLSAVNPHYARQIAAALQASPKVKSAAWYVTRDPWFADKPRVQSARGIRVGDNFFQAMTAKMTRFTL